MTDSLADTECTRRLRRDREILLISGVVAVLAFALKELPDERVAFRALSGMPLPQTCFSRSWLGLKCPGCGLTRSFIHLAEGDIDASWRSHRLGALMAVVIAIQVPYRLLAMRRLGGPLLPPRWQAAFAYALIALLLGNWLLELAAGRLAAV